MEPRPNVVAIFNTSPDTIDLLRLVLERAELVAVSAYTWELRDGKVDLDTFMRQHQPKVVVYDIAPPYEENWRLFQHIRQTPAMAGVPCVVTTTNPLVVGRMAAEPIQLFEIIGKPYDLGLVVEAVQQAIR